MTEPMIPVGTPVSKVGGDYRFDGVVSSCFEKLSGEIRYVVEDARGSLHIFSGRQLVERKVEDLPPIPAQRVGLDGAKIKTDGTVFNFLLRVGELCRDFGISIQHEDSHGCFMLTAYDPKALEHLFEAYDERLA